MNANSTAWILLLLPLLVVIAILPCRKRMPGLCALLAVGAALICLVLSLGLSFSDWGQGDAKPVPWIFSGESEDSFRVIIGLELDHLSRGTIIAVTLIGFATQTFLLMNMEKNRPSPFVEVALLLFAATGIVFSDGLVMLLFFTGLAGVCSFFLTSRCHMEETGRQIFVPGQVAFSSFLIGILFLWVVAKSNYFREIFPMLEGVGNHGLLGTGISLLCFGIVGQVIQMLISIFPPGRKIERTDYPSLVHGGSVLALGGYILARIFPLLAAVETVAAIFMLVGSVIAALFLFHKAVKFTSKKS